MKIAIPIGKEIRSYQREFCFAEDLKGDCGTPLAVQWLRLCLPVQGAQVRSLVKELKKSHMLHSQKIKT